MTVEEASNQFIQAWGKLGTSWGINRTMAQIHALLLISPKALSTEDIMERLNISRGNANMNIRALLDWGLAIKELRLGERKEFFIADKDMWSVARKVMKERKKKELTPLQEFLREIPEIEGDQDNESIRAMASAINSIQKFADSADHALDRMIRAEESWFFRIFMKFMR